MWSFRYEDLGGANWIYWIGIAFIAISLFFDKSIHKSFGFADFRKTKKRINEKAKWALEDQLEKISERVRDARMTPEEYKKRVKEIHKSIAALDD